MDEAVGRFALFAEGGVPAFGGERKARPIQVEMLNILSTQAFGGFDVTTTSESAAASAARAGTETMCTPYTCVDVDPNILIGRLVGRPTQRRDPWVYGPVGSRNGSGGAGTSEHAGTPTIHVGKGLLVCGSCARC